MINGQILCDGAIRVATFVWDSSLDHCEYDMSARSVKFITANFCEFDLSALCCSFYFEITFELFVQR